MNSYVYDVKGIQIMHLVFRRIAFQSTYWWLPPVPSRSATRWSWSILSRFLDRTDWSSSPKFDLFLFFRCFHSLDELERPFARMSLLRISPKRRALMVALHKLSFSCHICGGSCISFPFSPFSPFCPKICCIFCRICHIFPIWKVEFLRFQ